jgi:hypothetical protein
MPKNRTLVLEAQKGVNTLREEWLYNPYTPNAFNTAPAEICRTVKPYTRGVKVWRSLKMSAGRDFQPETTKQS